MGEIGASRAPGGAIRVERRQRSAPPAAAPAAAALNAIVSPRGEPFEVAGRAGPVARRPAPPIPAEAREELIVLKDGELFLCARTDGDLVPAGISGEGLYANDTRHLSELQLRIGGARPVPLSHTVFEDRAVLDATNANLRGNGSPPVRQLSLSITRELVVAGGRLFLAVRLRNFLRVPVHTSLALSVAADFADMFEVRGGTRRRARGHALLPRKSTHGLTLAYVGEDDVFRETIVQLDPAPATLEATGDGGQACWALSLTPGEPVEVLVTIEPSIGGRRRPRRRLTTAARELRRAESEWRAACTSIDSDNDRFNALTRTSAQDLRALQMPVPGGQMLAAGIPWYVAPFGRDALMAAGEALLLNPQLLRDSLQVLARLQAREDDPWRDAEPGKILHELRFGELASAGLVPHTPYYGSVDATPLFLMRAAEYHAWTGDLDTLRTLRPALDAALEWIDRYGDSDGDGFVEYQRRSSGGLRNQGWKDSEDAVVHADGKLADGPIALVEVQGYVYAAKQAIAGVYDALGLSERGGELRAQARTLREAFNEAFWNPHEGTFALALDGSKRQVASVTSNPGHCLYCGIVDAAKAGAVIDRLLAPDMFSGWGVRTLSSACPAYNPMSYHNGSVWPHDNAVIAAGCKRYGREDGVARIAGALFDVAAAATDVRLPELYCGFDRAERANVVAYPVACIPQAWAAAAPYLLLQALLGLSADASAGALTIERPMLPDWLGRIRLQGLRVGKARLTLDFQREGRATSFTLVEQTGALHVTMAAGRGGRPAQ